MSIKVSCACGKSLSARDELAGKRVRCPACHESLLIPKPDSAEAAVPEADWLGMASDTQAMASTRAAEGDRQQMALTSTRASSVRTGVSCYFFGFLVIFFAGCLGAVAPTLTAGDVTKLLSVIRVLNAVGLIAEIVIAVGLVLCVTAPEKMRGRGILYVTVLGSVLGLTISAATVWNPLLSLRVGPWLPHLVLLTTHASFFLFLRWLGAFLDRSEITNRASRVLVLLAIGATIWLGVFRAQPPMPNMMGRYAVFMSVLMLLLFLALGIVALIGLFSVIRLLSNCREVLRTEGPHAANSNSQQANAVTDQASKWLTRSDTVRLAIGSGLVSLTFWGWLLFVKPAPAVAPFPMGVPIRPSMVSIPGKKTLMLAGHTGLIGNVAFDPEWRRLATAGSDKTIKMWDASTAATLRTLTGHTAEVRRVQFSPDGKWLASASADKSVKIWNADNGQEVRTLTGHAGAAVSVAFSPDGQRLASASEDKSIKVWKVSTGEEQLSLVGHTEPVGLVVFSPDGTRLASAGGGSGEVRIWDATSGQTLYTLKGHSTLLSAIAFRPDGRQLATASYDMTVKLWDTTNGQETHTLVGHTGAVMGMAYRPDGKWLASTGVGMMVKEWDSANGQLCRTFSTNTPGGLTFSADGKRLASATMFGAVDILDKPPEQSPTPHTGHSGAVTSVAFSPDGQQIASASWDQTVRIWNATTGEEIHTLKGHAGAVGKVGFGADGMSLLSVGMPIIRPGVVKVWDAKSGRETHSQAIPVTGVVAISEDGTRVASPSPNEVGTLPAGANVNLKMWDVTRGTELLAFKGHSGPVMSVTISRDGKSMASMGGAFQKPGEIKVWDVSSGKETLHLGGQTAGATWLAISSDGQRLASSHADRTFKIWDATNGKELFKFKGHTSPATSLSFSPDGKWLASASGLLPGLQGEMKLWDVETGQEKSSLKGHKFGVSGLAFSPDSQRLASASSDETVKVWDITTGRELLMLGIPAQ